MTSPSPPLPASRSLESQAPPISTPTTSLHSNSDSKYPIQPQVLEAIQNVKRNGKKVVVMTCGIAGSGKSTLARSLEKTQNFTRLSIDKYIFEKHGVYDHDYAPEKLDGLQDEAEVFLNLQLRRILKGEEDEGGAEGDGGVVLDLSLYSKSDRDSYRGIVEKEGGGRWGVVLVVFKVRGELEEQEGVLWGRIEGREREVVGKRREGMPVSREVLRGYLRGFEWPAGEGEVVVDVV
ncbi:ATP/GTP-binding protein [Rhexocercosporidium sp. MPI-PUGE-AT-0058]|nr:ATP/GTP-binding protein [Rhexocercosporidium sp. MPI-PUGE-AT-0058]